MAPSVKKIIGKMPKIRSRISKGIDSTEKWQQLLREAPKEQWVITRSKSNDRLSALLSKFNYTKLPSMPFSKKYNKPEEMQDWYCDGNLNVLTLHEARSHMITDLYRYLYASSFSKIFKISPKLSDFPERLLPEHKNVEAGKKGKMFADRFSSTTS